MPKLKTHRGLRKKVKISANGKVKRKQAGKSHLNTSKNAKRRRNLRQTTDCTKAVTKRIKNALQA